MTPSNLTVVGCNSRKSFDTRAKRDEEPVKKIKYN